jgi:hypothetical protein
VEEEDDQVKKLIETKGRAFSASAASRYVECWWCLRSEDWLSLGNTSVVLRAQKEQLDLEAKKAEDVSKQVQIEKAACKGIGEC